MKPIVAIVGRPNVGKSSFFNYISGKKISIVEDTPGVTRDRVYVDADWRGREFTMIDTGGIEPTSKDNILMQMREQAEFAIDAADVVLMKSSLLDVPAAIRLSRKTLKTIHENLFWAFAYNVIGIPLAAGMWIPITGWEMNPMFGAAAMSLSSFCVVSNALRLNLFNMYDAGKDKKIKKHLQEVEEKEEEKSMTKTMKIEGMMCKHCEANVKKTLEALPEVAEAAVSHEAGTAVVTLTAEISNEALTKVIEDKDYKVISVE